MEDEPSLAAVFGATLGEDLLAQWNRRRVHYNLPLARLHSKFWGKSMLDEEEEWRNAQPLPLTDEGHDRDDKMDEDEDEDEDEDKGMDQDEGMDKDEGMDEDEGMDKDDDVISGCYMLDIGIRGIRISKMWIRAEYIRIFDYIEGFFKEPGTLSSRPPCAVITGQPGIGKSFWVYYALRRYLAEKKPFIWYLHQRCYLFLDEGVYEAPPDFDSLSLDTLVRTLVDPDANISGVPECLVDHETHHAVIYTTSPREEWWKRLHKTVRERVIIMNPWYRKEIHRVAQALFPDMTKERINYVFDRFGPTPRLCLEYAHDQARLQIYETQVEDTISELTMERLERFFKDSWNLSMTSNSHKICLINRESDLPGNTVVTIITQFIQKRLATQNRTVEQDDQIRLYERLANVSKSRALAGVAFEAAGQRQLQYGIKLDIMPMVRLRKSRQGSLPQWHSAHLRFADKTLHEFRRRALKKEIPINIPDPKMVEYGEKGPSSITANVLYLPKLTNQVALDSFILFENSLYIFQFTISKQHVIKPGLVDWYERCSGFPPMTCWRFVFVIPPDLHMKCPQPRPLKLRQLEPFSAVMTLKKSTTQTKGSKNDKSEGTSSKAPVKRKKKSAANSKKMKEVKTAKKKDDKSKQQKLGKKDTKGKGKAK